MTACDSMKIANLKLRCQNECLAYTDSDSTSQLDTCDCVERIPLQNSQIIFHNDLRQSQPCVFL